MKKKQIIILAIQLVFLLVVGMLLSTYVNSLVNPKTAYVFTKSLPVNTQITQEDVRAVSIPASAVRENFITSLGIVQESGGEPATDSIIGKYTATKVYADQYITKEMLITADEMDPFESMDTSKLRKISLPINFETGFGGNIKRGSKVDLVFTGEGSKTTSYGSMQKFMYSKVFIQDAYVYNVVTEDGNLYIDNSDKVYGDSYNSADGQQISTTTQSQKLAVVTIAVTLDQAEELTTRLRAGEVSLLGRFDGSESYETLGFVLGDYSQIFSGTTNAETNTVMILGGEDELEDADILGVIEETYNLEITEESTNNQ